jgi:hypothetical protein
MKRKYLLALMFLARFAAESAETWDNPPKEKIAGLEHKTFHSRSTNCDVGYNIDLPRP